MRDGDPIIRTKLRPPVTRARLVSRPRLELLVAQGLRGPLTLITAPAGFGKTTLVASCVTACSYPVAWLSLDKNDNQVGRFLGYLIAALQEAHESIGGEAAQLATAAQHAPPEAVFASLINSLDGADMEVALVLDDFQFIDDKAIQAGVAFLLDHCPSTLHLVIASRSDPPLPVARLRARGLAVELRAGDLAFSETEATDFLNEVMGLHLDAAAVTALEARTEGWIAGLQMAALSMRHHKDVQGFIEAFSGTNRYILDYLLEEVLTNQPPDIQRFLLDTSILERLTAPLCDAVLATDDGATDENGDRTASNQSPDAGRSASILEYLERANLFLVPMDEERVWFRYHHLFADLLRSRLRRSGRDRVARLLSRAAQWCLERGQVPEAIGYALAARDYRRAADLVARYWHQAANKGDVETVWSWLRALPEEVVNRSAPLGLAYCWVLWLRGQIGAIKPHLVEAERALDEPRATQEVGGDGTDEAELRAHFAVLRSIVARHGSDFAAAVSWAERALGLAPESLPVEENAQLRSVICLALASAFDGTGDLEKTVDALADAIHWGRVGENAAGVAGMTHWLVGALWTLGRLRSAQEATEDALRFLEERGMGRLPVAGVLHVRLSEVCLERNDVPSAEEHLSRGTELGRWSGRFDAARNGFALLARLRLMRGDVDGALAAVHEAESALGESPAPLARAELMAVKARVLVRKGALSEATQCVETAARLAGEDRGQIAEKIALAAARLTLAEGDTDRAIPALTASLTAAEARGRFGAAIEILILRSLALLRQGGLQEGCNDLERAIALAEPEGHVRVFLDEGQPMMALIAQWLARAGAHRSRRYAVRLLSQFDAEPQIALATQDTEHATGGLVETLSPRELEVLQLIAQGRTNQEIARELIVSVGTVKAHTASIYRKLDVANRTEAAARARRIGLLF